MNSLNALKIMRLNGRMIQRIKGSTKPTILLVDDDTSLCDSLAEILHKAGFEVCNVYTGVETIRAVKNRNFDAAIIDVRLPDLDSIEVLHWLKAGDSDMGILMMSGVATLEDAVNSINLGADAFSLKPIDPEEFISKIRKVTRLKRMERRLKESERHFRELLENCSDGILIIGLDWTIKFANQSCLNMMGTSFEEIEGISLLSIIKPFDSKLLLSAIKGPIEKERISLPKFEITCRNGVTLQVEAASSLMKNDGTPVGVQMILRNIDGCAREIYCPPIGVKS